jgi:4,5-dihydroxyphthalate decarboxylase
MTQLSAMMGTYAKTRPLKNREITSAAVELDFADIDVAQLGFKDVVRQSKYDVAELALMTFLLAFEAGKQYVLLPFVMNGSFHHKSIWCRAGPPLPPEELAGRSVAMRSYSQTTPTWVRGILADEYGMRLETVRWLVQEGAHVTEYDDPVWVTREESGRGLEELLLSDEVDVIIAGGGLSGDPRIHTMLPDPAGQAKAWHARTGVVPINHMVTIRREIAESRPEIVREVYRMLCAARDSAAEGDAPGAPVPQPAGFEQVAPALDLGIRYAHEQQLINKRYDPAELYGPVVRALA